MGGSQGLPYGDLQLKTQKVQYRLDFLHHQVDYEMAWMIKEVLANDSTFNSQVNNGAEERDYQQKTIIKLQGNELCRKCVEFQQEKRGIFIGMWTFMGEKQIN